MDEIIKNPSCDCGGCVEHDDVISNSIKKGFETLSNSLIECALILSSEDYAQSLVNERNAAKRTKEAEKKEREERRAKAKECSEKVLEVYTKNLKAEIDSLDLPDDEKIKTFNSLISNEPIQIDTSSELTKIVKKAFCEALKEVKPEVGKMITGDSMKFDPMSLALIVVPDVTIPPLTFVALTSGDNGKPGVDPMLLTMMMNKDADLSKVLPFLMTKKSI